MGGSEHRTNSNQSCDHHFARPGVSPVWASFANQLDHLAENLRTLLNFLDSIQTSYSPSISELCCNCCDLLNQLKHSFLSEFCCACWSLFNESYHSFLSEFYSINSNNNPYPNSVGLSAIHSITSITNFYLNFARLPRIYSINLITNLHSDSIQVSNHPFLFEFYSTLRLPYFVFNSFQLSGFYFLKLGIYLIESINASIRIWFRCFLGVCLYFAFWTCVASISLSLAEVCDQLYCVVNCQSNCTKHGEGNFKNLWFFEAGRCSRGFRYSRIMLSSSWWSVHWGLIHQTFDPNNRTSKFMWLLWSFATQRRIT